MHKPMTKSGISNALKILVISISIFSAFSLEAAAQNRNSVLRPKPKRVIKPITSETDTVPQKTVDISPARNTGVPVSVVNSPQQDYLSGEARVTVNPNQPTVIRLGLSQNAVSIVEFPASDGIYYIHEGNPKLASVFQSPTKETDRSITIYPGEGFVANKDGAISTAISLQMRSGLVLILELVPVNDLKRNAHRCVITYDRDSVISARKAAGLAFNLGGDSPIPVNTNSRAASKLVGIATPTETSIEETKSVDVSNNNTAVTEIPVTKSRGPKLKSLTAAEISKISNKRLAEVLRDQKKTLGTWTTPSNGLQLALSRTTDLDEDDRLVVVAVRNTTTTNLRLISGSPELQLQTLDKDGNSLLTSKIDIQYTETTALDGLILPGSTTFFALVYNAPTLGVNQKIRVIAAHRDAADAPVAASLNGSNK